MSEQGNLSPSGYSQCLENMPFVNIFTKGGFRSALQPGKLMLAVFGIALIFLAGWILDGIWPDSARVVLDASSGGLSELNAYVEQPGIDLAAFRAEARKNNERLLVQMLRQKPMDMDENSAEKLILEGKALSRIKTDYSDYLQDALNTLAERYVLRAEIIDEQYDAALKAREDEDVAQKRQERNMLTLQMAYRSLFQALLTGRANSLDVTNWVNELIQRNPQATGEAQQLDQTNYNNDQKVIVESWQLAQTLNLASSVKGKGIFSTFVNFKMTQANNAVKALVFGADTKQVKTYVYQYLMGLCWLTRFHPVFALFMIIIGLAIWAVVGGAICRITALQFAREERIGPIQALKYSLGKFPSYFSAPLIPIAIILVICIVIFGVSWIVAVPVIGELLGSLLFPLALVGGFIIALVAVGLMGGFNLMFPTIAVEGSDSFDAISRSFSYVFARPWRMGFYTAVAAIYGAVCYLFVRFFTFLLLIGTHYSSKFAVNFDSSARMIIRGKLDAMWPTPTFSHLLPEVSWVGLNFSESFGAALILVWVAIVVAALLGFVVSFFFSVNTIIYFLLRRQVDATDLEDVYVEQDVEDLMSEEAQEVAEPDTEAKPTEDSPRGKSESEMHDSEYNKSE